MSGPASRTVGLSQRIRLEWLDEAAELAQAGRDRAHAWSALAETLQEKVSIGGTSPRSNREKTLTILTRIWCGPPLRLVPLRDAGLRLSGRHGAGGGHGAGRGHEASGGHAVRRGHGTNGDHRTGGRQGAHRALGRPLGHDDGGLPFWNAVAAQVGRLLRLQGIATAAQVHRRVQERYGERPTVARATQRAVRSFVDWGVLADTETRGRYVAGEPCPVRTPALAAWLAEAALHVRDGEPTAPVQELLGQPGLFPFRVSYVTARGLAAESPRLDVAHQGLDTEVMMLRVSV